MHLVLPFAFALSPGARPALQGLELPHLRLLLSRLVRVAIDEGDALSLSPPHERALARALGWPTDTDGLLPLAARAAHALNLPEATAPDQGWAFVHPTHWHVGTEQMSLADPQGLALAPAEEDALFDALATLCEPGSGWALHRSGTPGQPWLARHAVLAQLPTASLDRVIGRNVDPWLEATPATRAALRQVRRLQAEAQMLLHSHPVNAEREARHLPAVNSLWFCGSGTFTPTQEPTALHWDERLRSPALNEDWPAWALAWQALDAGPLRALCELPPAQAQLTLCGERHAHHYAAGAARPWWQRGWLAPAGPTPLVALETL